MYSHETGRLPALNVESLERRDVPAAFGVRQPLNSLLSVIQFASDTANNATNGPPAPAGSLAAIGQAAKQVLADTTNLVTDAGALAIDGSVLAEETGLLTAGAATPGGLPGALAAIVAFEKATERNVVGTTADAALLTNYLTTLYSNPTFNNGVSVAIQTGVVIADIANNSIGAVVTDTLAVIQDAANLYSSVSALNTAVQQYGGYSKLAADGVQGASSLISAAGTSLGNIASDVLTELKGVAQDFIDDAKQAASDLSSAATSTAEAFSDYILSLVNSPSQTTGVFDPDNDDDDDSGLSGY